MIYNIILLILITKLFIYKIKNLLIFIFPNILLFID